MKKTMRFLSLAALALVGAVMTGCSNEDDFTVEPENKSNVVTLITTVGISGGAETRALAADGVKTFAAGEQLAVIYKNTSGATVKAVSAALTAGDIQSGNKTATFTFELTDPNKAQNVTYIYPAAMASTTDENYVNYAALNSQDGSLSTLSSNLDLATYSGAWDGASLPTATLENQLAFLAVTLKDADGSNDITSSITNMTINDGTTTYTVSRSAVAGPIYVAIRPTTSANIWVSATTGSKEYGKSLSSKTYEAGNGYNVTWRMKELTTVTWNSDNVFNESNSENKVGIDMKPSYSYAEGITLSYTNNGGGYSYFMPYYDGRAYFQVIGSDYFTFTAPEGKQFTKIEINYGDSKGDLASQANWTKPNNNKIIWSGTPSNAVNLIGKTSCNETSSIVFTLMDE